MLSSFGLLKNALNTIVTCLQNKMRKQLKKLNSYCQYKDNIS